MKSLAVTSSMLKTFVNFEVLLLNSGYAPFGNQGFLVRKFVILEVSDPRHDFHEAM